MDNLDNLEKLRNELKAATPSALLISDLANVFWLTGFSGSFGTAVVTPSANLLISDSRYTLQAQEQAIGWDVRTFANPTDSVDFLREQLESISVRAVGFDKAVVTVGTLEKWTEKMPQIALTATTDPIALLRRIKSDVEVDKIRAACRLADSCLEHVAKLLRPGVTENELAFEVEIFFRKNGAVPAFTPIVVSGERSARPHGLPSDKVLETGDFVTFDLGAKLNDYCSDITRTFVLGEPTARHSEVYNQVLKAQEAAIAALIPGAKTKEVDALVRTILGEKDMAKYFGHGLGHGLGALVHDSGRLSPTEDDLIEAGQVWTVEPGVYIEGFGGVRIEDDVLVTPNGPEILTHFPKTLLAVSGS